MTKKIRVLQFSTHDEECGIAKYQAQFIDGMSGIEDIDSEYFPYSPNQTKRMNKAEFSAVLNQLAKQMRSFDILHIQHEFSFFSHQELDQIISKVRSLGGKRIIVTIHTSPDVQYVKPVLGGMGPKSFAHLLRTYIASRRFLRRYVAPLNGADLILVHNRFTKKSLVSHGIKEAKIAVIKIPVPTVSFDVSSGEIKRHLDYKKGDTIFCTVGFMSRNKGVFAAVKALTYLPDNYKLAVVGGSHPNSPDTTLYDEVCDLITSLGLQQRVYIAGYVEDDNRLNSLIRECDICVYPFDNNYYAYVSSASLNNAFANHKPVIAYPTTPFLELNEDSGVLTFCKSPSYYELAREISTIDKEIAGAASKKYAQEYAYDKEAAKFVNIYRNLGRASS